MAYRRDNEDHAAGLRRLKEDLRGKAPGRCYVFFGEEDYLQNYYLDSLKKLILDGPAAEFNYHRFSGETLDCDGLEDALNAIPMMAERSFIRVDDFDFFDKKEDAVRSRLAALLSDLPDYCTLVFNYVALPWKPDKRLKKLWEAISQNAAIVEFAKQSDRELCAWTVRHFRSYGKEIDGRLADYLVFLTGSSMTTLAREIEKIAAYSQADSIVKADIDEIVEPVLTAAVFEITDALSAGNFASAMNKLHEVLRMQEDPFSVLGAIAAQFRRIRAAKVLLSEGRNAQDLSSMTGVQGSYANRLMNAAAALPPEFWSKAVLLCEETDFRIKNSYDTPERMLELLLLRISEEARHA